MRERLAWLIYCFAEGYRTPEDRAILENWILLPDERLNAEDVETKRQLLLIADEILGVGHDVLAIGAVQEQMYHHRHMAEAELARVGQSADAAIQVEVAKTFAMIAQVYATELNARTR